VPDDASVVSVGDTDLSQLFAPAITSLSWDLDAVGRALAELLLRRLGRDAVAEPERIVMTTQLVLRESCSPLTRAAVPARRRKELRA
jgi:LacI family transcriptional regulator